MKLGYSSDNRQDCTHCRFYLKDTPFQNDTAKLQLFQKPTRGWMKFYCNELSIVVCFTRITVNVPRIVINCLGNIASGCGWLQQPCHADTGLCGGGHLWLRYTGSRPSYYENPTLHIGVWWDRPFRTHMLFQTQRYPIIMQPFFTFLIIGHYRENRIPKLTSVLGILQVCQFMDDQIINNHRLSHYALPMKIDSFPRGTGCPM